MTSLFKVRRCTLCAAIMLALLIFPGTRAVSLAADDIRPVTVDGSAGLQDNPAIARDNAITDALRKGVEQAVGLMLSSETLVENSALVSDSIYSKTQGYVKKYRVVTEGPRQGLYLVTLEAEVGVGEIRNDLGALGLLQTRAGKPRILFMVAEQHAGTPRAWWLGAAAEGAAVSETAMKEEFMAKEFNVIDVAGADKVLGSRPEYRAAEPADALAREMGSRLGAEILIKGRAQVKEGPRTAGSVVGSYLADVNVSAFRIDSGQQLAAGRGQGVARHIAANVGENNALELAGRDAARKLSSQILAAWTAETSGVQMTRITVRGLSGLPDLVKVREFLTAQVRGVQNVIQRSFEGGVAVLDVSARANAQQIGDGITEASVPGLGLRVTAASATTLEVTCSVAPAGK